MKTLRIVVLLGCILGIARADVDVAFILNPSLGGSAVDGLAISDPAVTITTNASGNDLVYSFTYENADLDGGGAANDTLSWDLRWEFFEASALAGGQITTGTDAQGSLDGITGWGDSTPLWNRDTLKFTIENVNLTADAGYTVSFDGFNRIWLTAGTYYIGEGADTAQLVTGANGNAFFDRTEALLITAWGNERNRALGGSFTVIPEPSTIGLVGAASFMALVVRRFRM
jgi:hypothetical protein